MASLVRRPGGRFDIRESVATPDGPRSRTLATFRGALTPEVLDRAARRAARPFLRTRLVGRALELGIPVTERSEERAARALLADLRAGIPLEPGLRQLLLEALRAVPTPELDPSLVDVSDWISVDAVRRGAALRDLLRLSDRIVRSRRSVRGRSGPRFPRFRSRGRRGP